jgi:hypothetical protein
VKNALAFFKDSYCLPRVKTVHENGWIHYSTRINSRNRQEYSFIKVSKGFIHNKRGPAIIDVYYDGDDISVVYSWWIRGKQLTKNDILNTSRKQLRWETIQLLLQL